jgi:hypothetical protein
MVMPKFCLMALTAGVIALAQPAAAATPAAAPASDAVAAFAPRPDGRDHRLDYSVWTEALRAYVVSMGPPLRRMPERVAPPPGTRQQIGPTSMYRNDGSMIGYALIDREVMANIARYRRELQAVADTLDIPALPRNEQLAFWINLHNVAMVEKIGENWPVRQPRKIKVDGVPLDDAQFIMVQGVALSPRDIREKIVFAHWKNPKVIYGFWRGEIGGPALQRDAFDGRVITDQLDMAAREFTNSRRGVEQRGDTLHVSRLYAEAAPFYFRDFAPDLRTHLRGFVEGEVIAMLDQTSFTKASLSENDIADLSGGRNTNPFFASGRIDAGVAKMLEERSRKFDYMQREDIPTFTITVDTVPQPDDPPKDAEVE